MAYRRINIPDEILNYISFKGMKIQQFANEAFKGLYENKTQEDVFLDLYRKEAMIKAKQKAKEQLKNKL